MCVQNTCPGLLFLFKHQNNFAQLLSGLQIQTKHAITSKTLISGHLLSMLIKINIFLLFGKKVVDQTVQ